YNRTKARYPTANVRERCGVKEGVPRSSRPHGGLLRRPSLGPRGAFGRPHGGLLRPGRRPQTRERGRICAEGIVAGGFVRDGASRCKGGGARIASQWHAICSGPTATSRRSGTMAEGQLTKRTANHDLI